MGMRTWSESAADLLNMKKGREMGTPNRKETQEYSRNIATSVLKFLLYSGAGMGGLGLRYKP